MIKDLVGLPVYHGKQAAGEEAEMIGRVSALILNSDIGKYGRNEM